MSRPTPAHLHRFTLDIFATPTPWAPHATPPATRQDAPQTGLAQAERECSALCARAEASSEAGCDEQALHDAHQAFELARHWRLHEQLLQTLSLMGGLHARLGDVEGAKALLQQAELRRAAASHEAAPSVLQAALQDHLELVLTALHSLDATNPSWLRPVPVPAGPLHGA